MNEEQWLTSMDPQRMLSFLRQQDRLSDRKARLFAVACCRRVWDRIPADACRRAVEAAERYADGQATSRELVSAWSAVVATAREEGINLVDDYEQESIRWGDVPGGLLFLASLGLVGEGTVDAARVASDAGLEAAWEVGRLRSGREAANLAFHATYLGEEAAHSHLLHDIVKNPFRSLRAIPASLLTWSDGLVPRLAEQAYEHRLLPSGQLDPERLGVLADALKEAGADDNLVAHLRGLGRHVRGCWAVDYLTGRK